MDQGIPRQGSGPEGALGWFQVYLRYRTSRGGGEPLPPRSDDISHGFNARCHVLLNNSCGTHVHVRNFNLKKM